jgi:serine/threonine-protein kinase HipA
MSFRQVDLVGVRAWSRDVGFLAPDPSGYFVFEYEPDWVRTGRPLAPFTMPQRPGQFVFRRLNPETYHRLPSLIADSLPDRFGNALVDAWLSEQGVPSDAVTSLDRLAYLADRGMGALTFHPPVERPDAPTTFDMGDLVTAARAAVSGNLDEAPRNALHQLIQVGTSAGGARAKAVVAYHPDTGDLRSGQVDVGDGYEHWLIKLDGVSADATREDDAFLEGQGYGRIEFAYHRMATAAGLEMMESRLLEEGGRAHFLTKRFDRRGSHERVHVQTLCAMDHLDFNLAGASSYAQYFDVLDRLGLSADRREQAFRRVVFNVAAVNRDDHTKNLSFLLPEDGDWDLAPAYDVTHAHRRSGGWTQRHQMTVNGKSEWITLADLEELGERRKVPGVKAALGEVLGAVERWAEFADEAGVDARRRDRVAADLAEYRPR